MGVRMSGGTSLGRSCSCRETQVRRIFYGLRPVSRVVSANESIPRPWRYSSPRRPSTRGVSGDPVVCLPTRTATCRWPEGVGATRWTPTAGFSVDGNFLYVIGGHTLMSFEWDGVRLLRDDSWSVLYRDLADPTRSHGWDVVISNGYATWLDHGARNHAGTMRGRPSARGRFVRGVRPSRTRWTSTGSSRSGSRTRV